MRGEDEDPHWSGLGDRNTPTCVGKTRTRPIWRCVREKHPHVRGEDSLFFTPMFFFEETPPRAWGRPAVMYEDGTRERNTPTCVGKTLQEQCSLLGIQKHPHVRGEDATSFAIASPEAETPPRAWGRPFHCLSHKIHLRNTPTCVGKTLRDYSLFLLSRQNNIETSSFSDTSCSPDNSMSWRFGSPMP